MDRRSLIRIAAAVITLCGLALLVLSLNTHGDHAQAGVASFVRDQSQGVLEQRARERVSDATGGGGLEVVDMFQCMCATPLGTDIRGWVGLWLVTVMVGGVPTAILLGSRNSHPS
jgi:hypothetical protein